MRSLDLKRWRNEVQYLDVDNVWRYYDVVIVSWADAEAKKIFNRERSRRLPFDIQQTARRKLLMLEAATRLDDLRIPPSNRLEKLSGDRAGQWSIRINDQWRICFTWSGGNAAAVEIADYH